MDVIGPADPANSNPLDCFALASAKDPLTLSLSPLGRGDPITCAAGNSGVPSPRPHPLAGAAAIDVSSPGRADAERERVRGDFCDPINRFRYRCGRLHLHVPPSASLGGYS